MRKLSIQNLKSITAGFIAVYKAAFFKQAEFAGCDSLVVFLPRRRNGEGIRQEMGSKIENLLPKIETSIKNKICEVTSSNCICKDHRNVVKDLISYKIMKRFDKKQGWFTVRKRPYLLNIQYISKGTVFLASGSEI